MIVNTPDGPVKFPDNMSNDDIKGVLQKKYGFQSNQSSDTASSWFSDFARRAANTFGVADKMIAQGRATLPMMYPGLFGQNASVVQPGGAYDPATQEARATKDLAEERAKTAAAGERLGPYASAAADITGYLPLAAVTGGVGLGPIATSAIGGGLAGAGHSTATDPSGIAQDAATSAAINAATAGLLTKGAPYLPKLVTGGIRQFAPVAAASLGGAGAAYIDPHLAPVGAYMAGEAVRKVIPEAAPTADSWLTPWINKITPWSNTGVQGVLSGQGY